jgi:metallo-beta-lactamase family protein
MPHVSSFSAGAGSGRIGDAIPRVLPIYLDSPMAVDASETFCKDIRYQRLNQQQCRATCAVAQYVSDVEESKALDAGSVPKVIISASGMAAGGRVIHHLKVFGPDRKSTIPFAGFQAGGTRGAAMTAGAQSVKIHDQYVPIRADVENLHMLSAHADADEIMAWLRNFERRPQRTFITHGKSDASDALRHRIEEELGWSCTVPEHRESVELP